MFDNDKGETLVDVSAVVFHAASDGSERLPLRLSHLLCLHFLHCAGEGRGLDADLFVTDELILIFFT